MNIKLKKLTRDNLAIRTEGNAEIQEIIVKEDLLFPEKEKIHICYRGPIASGIIEFSPEEIKNISKRLEEKNKAIGKIKVFKSKKR